jgi:hypothetical protein
MKHISTEKTGYAPKKTQMKKYTPGVSTGKDREPMYWSCSRIAAMEADYSIVYGERGNGKTYSVQELALKDWVDSRARMLAAEEENDKGCTLHQTFMLRRWKDDVGPSKAENFWDGNMIEKLKEWTSGEFTGITLRNRAYYACTYDDKGKPLYNEQTDCIGYVWSLSEAERLKGQSYPFVTTIIFEEFISMYQNGYIGGDEEVTLLMNIVSTIARDRLNVRIWMLGNTVNPYNPYFKFFGFKADDVKQGEIRCYEDEKTGCRVAVEYCGKRRKGSLRGTSAKYFPGDSAAANMITGGKWQLPEVPIMKPKDAWSKETLYRILLEFDDHHIQIRLLTERDGFKYLYIDEVKAVNWKKDTYPTLVQEPVRKRNYYTDIRDIHSKYMESVFEAYNAKRVWYDSRETASYFRTYLNSLKTTIR